MSRLKKIITRSKTRTPETPLAEQINSILSKMQWKTAGYLNRKTASWSPRKTKAVLIVFCALCGSMILFSIARSVLSANGPPNRFKAQRAITPKTIAPRELSRPNPTDSTLLKNHH